jgi:hypothetical protein
MPSYDASNYEPPAPVAQVTLRNLDATVISTEIPLLVDSGADATLLPRSAVERLGVQPLADTHYELIGFDGNRSLASAVIVDVIFLDRIYRGRYLLIDAEQGILGRDVLNHVVLLLNGPGKEWSQGT